MSRTTRVLAWAVLAAASATTLRAGPPGGVIRDTPYYGHHTTTRADGMHESSRHSPQRSVRYSFSR